MLRTLAYLEDAGYETVGRYTDSEMVAAIVERQFGALVIAEDLGVDSRARVRGELAIRQPGTPVVEGVDGVDALLTAVAAALNRPA
jgi:hypothetical protein